MPNTTSASRRKCSTGRLMTPLPVPEGKRMVLGEGALALQRGHDRRLQQLGQLQQLVRGLGVQHALAGVDHRAARLQQHARAASTVARVAGRRVAFTGGILQGGFGHLLERDVGGDLDHHRAGPAHLQEIEGAAHDLGDLACQVQRLDRLGHRGVGARRAEQGKDLGPVALMPERQEQHRGGVGVRGGHAREGVLGARAVLHGEHAERLAVGDPA